MSSHFVIHQVIHELLTEIVGTDLVYVLVQELEEVGNTNIICMQTLEKR